MSTVIFRGWEKWILIISKHKYAYRHIVKLKTDYSRGARTMKDTAERTYIYVGGTDTVKIDRH